ncbi:predicted protein [Uncinocarpus reesii 1704]|uniref:Uncharacterized protein n=1 Tax=Uncinocarpus reesii (strain UAMH 1704) TaxID=336963 RepID=C4JUY1_UNCRE|nr:uncharacterized protein UREG_04934 [Uncinocarpus reesii 1704]EEP80092.1 predicted protein [Uncinocarpus reesii 1704]
MAVLIPFLKKLVAIRLLIPTGPAAQTSAPPKPQGRDSGTNGASRTTAGLAPGILDTQSLSEIVELDDRIFNEAMGARLADKELYSKLKVLGLGWKAWELGEFYTIPVTEGTKVFDLGLSALNGTDAGNAILPSLIATPGAAPIEAESTSSQVQDPQRPNAQMRRTWNAQQSVGTPSAISPSSTSTVLGKRKQPPCSRPESSRGPAEFSTYATPDCSQTRNSTSHIQSQQTDAAGLLEELGSKLSEDTRAKIVQCIHEPAVYSIGGEKVLWRRKVRRVGWEVLKHWEIWGLDVQEI